MRSLEFYQLDVFTDEAFAGNPLAVFPECGDLETETMQKIAREMNLSETVFVQPSEIALRKLRIFTPKQELPLAGHPVVGTWNLLAKLGIVRRQANSDKITIHQELKAGILPVEILFEGNDPTLVTMTQAEFSTGKILDDDESARKLAHALGITKDEFSDSLPIQAVSTGIFSLAVPVASLEVLSRCRVNSGSLAEIYLSCGAIGCYPFTFETIEKSSSVHARFFAPDDGIAEDPATGSAAGALAAYLVHHGAIQATAREPASFILEQGDFMDRPSRIHLEVAGCKGHVNSVRVGGKSCLIAKGEIYV